jgi:hypothetical protein
MRRRKKALAASFVVTFATACEGKSAPLAPPQAQALDVGRDAGAGVDSGTGAGTGRDTGTDASASASAETPPRLIANPPPAPTFGHLVHQPDGTCLWYVDVKCPVIDGRVTPCNPPRPRRVECP